MHLNLPSLRLAALAFGVAVACPFAAKADPIVVDLFYASTVGAKIQFDGNSHFTFTPGIDNILLTSPGDTQGLLGEVTGSFLIGDVTKVGAISSAPVTGIGTLVIHDGDFNLTAELSWRDILQIGAGDFLNTNGAMNLAQISYGGANPTLLALAALPSTAVDVLSFQFAPAKALSKLKTTQSSTSFSGSIYATRNVPDGGNTMLLLGAALASTVLLRARRLA